MGITKVGVGRFLVGSYIVLDYHKEMEENYAKGNWLEAAKDTGFFAVKMLPIVAPAFVFGTLAPVWGVVAVGVVGTAIVVEVTGLGDWRDVRDILLDPPSAIPSKEAIDTAVEAVKETATGIVRETREEVERRIQLSKQRLELGWTWVEDNWRWFNPTPGFSW